MSHRSESSPPPSREDVIAKAGELGFAFVRFAPASLPPNHQEAFDRWLSQEMHAGMDWITAPHHRHREAHDLLPDAKSVLVLALSYATKPENTETSASYGVISRYARGRNYHNVFRKKLKKLVTWLASFGGTHTATVDSRPLFERAYAQQSGLGFIGKNTCLIHPEHGSFLFLATVVSSFSWPEDAPLALDCKDCRRCLDACPTGALREPYVLDARRCINYLTIEHKGDIPEELARTMGHRLFGCDTCQQVCPYNRDIAPTDTLDFAIEKLPARFPLDEIDALENDEAFRKRFEGTALMRIDLQRLKRNARIVRNNTQRHK